MACILDKYLCIVEVTGKAAADGSAPPLCMLSGVGTVRLLMEQHDSPPSDVNRQA